MILDPLVVSGWMTNVTEGIRAVDFFDGVKKSDRVEFPNLDS